MKKIIESIYGMQYEELLENGKDGGSARFNGNIFIAAYIIVILFVVILALTHIADYNESMNRFYHKIFGDNSGKLIGKILAVPLLAGIYFIVSKTIGSVSSFEKHVEAYSNYSTADKQKSFRRALFPFLGLLGLMLVLALV